jgi:hypothetical protein
MRPEPTENDKGMQGSVVVPQRTLMGAEMLNAGIFNEIGISMKWKEIRNRKTDPACANILMEFTLL